MKSYKLKISLILGKVTRVLLTFELEVSDITLPALICAASLCPRVLFLSQQEGSVCLTLFDTRSRGYWEFSSMKLVYGLSVPLIPLFHCCTREGGSSGHWWRRKGACTMLCPETISIL